VDEVLDCFGERFPLLFCDLAARQYAGNADIEQVELRGLTDYLLSAAI